jgi:glycosyltransferase involved in cell wall biosynthesis
LGVAGARNVGIIESTSEYISFLDDDDLRLPGTIDAQVRLLADRPDAGMVYGRALYGDQDSLPRGGFYPDECPQGDVFWQLLRSNFVPCATVVFRRTCLLRVGMLDEAVPGIEDWDLWIRIAELYPVLAFEQPVAIWRQPTPTSTQFTSRPDRLHRQMHRLHRNKWSRLPRVQAARLARRRQAARDFADYSAQQLTWELLRRLKGGQTAGSARVALALATMYPLTATRKLFQAIIRKRSSRQTIIEHDNEGAVLQK